MGKLFSSNTFLRFTNSVTWQDTHITWLLGKGQAECNTDNDSYTCNSEKSN
jgi:hypothetical protein